VSDQQHLESLDKRSLTLIEKHAREVMMQCAHLRRNGAGDEIRFGLIFVAAYDCVTEARRAFRRRRASGAWIEHVSGRGAVRG
jgi:hypothetical protein